MNAAALAADPQGALLSGRVDPGALAEAAAALGVRDVSAGLAEDAAAPPCFWDVSATYRHPAGGPRHPSVGPGALALPRRPARDVAEALMTTSYLPGDGYTAPRAAYGGFAGGGGAGASAGGAVAHPRRVPVVMTDAAAYGVAAFDRALALGRVRATAAAPAPPPADKHGFRYPYPLPAPGPAPAPRHPAVPLFVPAPGAEDAVYAFARSVQPDHSADLADHAAGRDMMAVEPLTAREAVMRDIAAEATHVRDPYMVPRTGRSVVDPARAARPPAWFVRPGTSGPPPTPAPAVVARRRDPWGESGFYE